MDEQQSVTQWIEGIKAGEAEAAERLWQRYFQRLVVLARARLKPAPKSGDDEEDVALSAFKSLCLGAGRGQFPQLRDRDHLWPLLVCITVRKAIDAVERQQRLKRGGKLVQDQAALANGDNGGLSIDELLGKEPSPEVAAVLSEEYQRLLDLLDPAHRQIAVSRMEGYRVDEIALDLGVNTRTITRKLALIRRVWESSGGDD